MEFPNGKRRLKTYASKEESYKDFKKVWKKGYDMYPNLKIAIRWTGNDNAGTWLSIVNEKYYN